MTDKPAPPPIKPPVAAPRPAITGSTPKAPLVAPRPSVPAMPQRAPAKELDKPDNSLSLTKTKPMALVDGKHPFIAKIARPRPNYVSMLLMGPSGAGKTNILGSAAFDERTSPILVLSADASSKSTRGIPEDKLTTVHIETWEDLSEAWDFLMFTDHGFKSLGLDNLTALHVYSMLTIVEQKTETSKENRRTDNTQTEQSDYGNSMAQMRKILILLKRLKLNLFCTSHPKSMNIPRVGTVQGPSMFGQMAAEVAGDFDICAYVSAIPLHDTKNVPTKTVLNSNKEDVTRFVYLQNTPQLLVKVRNDWNKNSKDFVQIDRHNAMTTILDAVEGK